MPSFTISFDEEKPRLWSSSKRISFEDYLDLEACLFNWGDSYDAKDWARLKSIIAPTLLVDYTDIGKACWPAMPAADFMAMITDDDFLGDPCVATQHLLGATRWERVSDTQVIGHHQLRAAHIVYTTAARTEVKLKGHSHATNEHYYTKVDGVWKFAGLKPKVRMNEGPFEKVFKGSYKEDSKMETVKTTPAVQVKPVSGNGLKHVEMNDYGFKHLTGVSGNGITV